MTDKDKSLVPIQRDLVASLDRQLTLTEKLLTTTRSAQGLLDVFCVPKDGTIEDAVNKVRPGGTIKIAKSEYFIEQGIFVDKPLRIEGEGMEETTVSYRPLENSSSYLSNEDSESNYLFSFITKGKIEINNICLKANNNYLNFILNICADEVQI